MGRRWIFSFPIQVPFLCFSIEPCRRMLCRKSPVKRRPKLTAVHLTVYDFTHINDYSYWLGFGVYHSGVQGWHYVLKRIPFSCIFWKSHFIWNISRIFPVASKGAARLIEFGELLPNWGLRFTTWFSRQYFLGALWEFRHIIQLIIQTKWRTVLSVITLSKLLNKRKI